MKYPAFLISAIAALAGTVVAHADNFVTITPTGSTAATVINRWVIGSNQSGLGYIDGNSGFAGATATNFFTVTGAPIGALGSPTGFTSYLPASGAATAQGSVGNAFSPDSYSGLTYVAENLSLIGPLSFYAIHHRTTGDYLALIQPSVPTVSDQKPMSSPGNSLTPGATGYFALSYAADNPGLWGAQLFYYLRTNGLGETVFGSMVPALGSGPTDRWNLGANRGFTDLAYTSTDVGFGFGASQFYYLRLDPITQTTFFGRINPSTGVATDIQNLGGVFRTLVFTPTNVGFGANNFYSIGQTSQTIAFTAIAAHTACDAPFTFVYPTASSGLAVTVAVTGPATIAAGNVITLTGAVGTVAITASQVGNLNFSAAANVVQSFAVTACAPVVAAQSILFAPFSSHTACDGSFSFVYPIATSGLPVALAITGPATLSAGNVITLTGATGVVTLTATQAGNGSFSAATTVVRTFTVTACAVVDTPQTITFAPISSHGLCENSFAVNPSSSSGLPVILSVVSGPATVSGYVVTMNGAGTVVLRATVAPATGYEDAAPVTQSFLAAKCAATIELGHLTKTYFGVPFNALNCVIATTTPAGLTVITTYNGSTTLPAAVGTYTVIATIDDPRYQGTATATFTLLPDLRVAQTVSFGAIPITNHVMGDAPFTLAPTSSSGMPATLAVISGPATVSGYTVTLTGTGNVVLEVSQAGNINTTLYAAQRQSFVVTPASPAPLLTPTGAVSKITGAAIEVGSNIVHPNGGIYDQVMLQGPAATVTADPGQVVRVSFVDLTNDIVQVEFSGAGSLALTLDNATGPALATNYNQPGVLYMRGHASIVITGADQTTNVMVFSVGRITAINQALFRNDVAYDGWADISSITIVNSDGHFGGLRAGNTTFSGASNAVGVHARGVAFSGPVVIGDIVASDGAEPVILLGSASDVRIAGGEMLQANNREVEVSGINHLEFTAGTSSHGATIPAQVNRGVYQQDGANITAAILGHL